MESQTKKNKQSSCTHFKRDTTVRSTRSSSSMLLIGVMLMQRVARVRLKQLQGLDLTTCC